MFCPVEVSDLYFELGLIRNTAGKSSLGGFDATPFQPFHYCIWPKSKPHPLSAGAEPRGLVGAGPAFESRPRSKNHWHGGMMGCLKRAVVQNICAVCAICDIMSSIAEIICPATYLPKVPAPDTYLPNLLPQEHPGKPCSPQSNVPARKHTGNISFPTDLT